MDSQIDFTIEGSTARCRGNWIAANLHEVEQRWSRVRWPSGQIRFDLREVQSLDTAGAWLLDRTIHRLEDGSGGRGNRIELVGTDEHAQQLFALVRGKSEGADQPPKPYVPGVLESIGGKATGQLAQYLEFLGFLGNLAIAVAQAVLRPWRIRGAQVVRELQAAGVDALPIVGLLSFLIGIVIAYQGGIVLRDYGANLYVADIVGLSMVRELAPLITAIIVAGRTGSAYTAQIGTMVVTEEVDALRSLGIAPLDMLVLPKLFALIIALPLLTVFADTLGLLGGLIMSKAMLGLNPHTFVNRLAEALTLQSYLSGVGKAPVFAAIIAAVGCFQGFRVFGGAASVGRQTTVSVVQSIFLVIIVDAAFSIAFSKLGI